MLRVNLHELHRVIGYIDEINQEDLDDIEFIFDGEEVSPPEFSVNNWKIVGLNNLDFIKAYMPLRESE